MIVPKELEDDVKHFMDQHAAIENFKTNGNYRFLPAKKDYLDMLKEKEKLYWMKAENLTEEEAKEHAEQFCEKLRLHTEEDLKKLLQDPPYIDDTGHNSASIERNSVIIKQKYAYETAFYGATQFVDKKEEIKDDTDARAERLENFHNAADSLCSTSQCNRISKLPAEYDAKEIELDVIEVEGYPGTTVNSVMTGTIQCVLTFAPESLKPIIMFDVKEGTVEFSARENTIIGNSLYCCCFRVASLNALSINYEKATSVTQQFVTLDVTNTVINAMCYVKDESNYAVNTATEGFTSCCICFNPCFDCCAWCNCAWCNCCPPCNKVDVEKIDFSLKADHRFGVISEQPANNVTFEEQGLKMTATKNSRSETYIVLDYLSPIDNGMHKCKLKLRNNDYELARKFVFMLDTLRLKHMAKLLEHPPAHAYGIDGTSMGMPSVMGVFNSGKGGGGGGGKSSKGLLKETLRYFCWTGLYHSACCGCCGTVGRCWDRDVLNAGCPLPVRLCQCYFL